MPTTIRSLTISSWRSAYPQCSAKQKTSVMKSSTVSPSRCLRVLNFARSKIVFGRLTKCCSNRSFTTDGTFSRHPRANEKSAVCHRPCLPWSTPVYELGSPPTCSLFPTLDGNVQIGESTSASLRVGRNRTCVQQGFGRTP